MSVRNGKTKSDIDFQVQVESEYENKIGNRKKEKKKH